MKGTWMSDSRPVVRSKAHSGQHTRSVISSDLQKQILQKLLENVIKVIK